MNERLWCYLATWCCFIPPVQSVLVQIQREKIRNRKKIENSFTMFLLSFICYPCALAQTRLELLNDDEVGKYAYYFNKALSDGQIYQRDKWLPIAASNPVEAIILAENFQEKQRTSYHCGKTKWWTKWRKIKWCFIINIVRRVFSVL